MLNTLITVVSFIQEMLLSLTSTQDRLENGKAQGTAAGILKEVQKFNLTDYCLDLALNNLPNFASVQCLVGYREM